MRRPSATCSLLAVTLGVGGCALVERPPRGWPEPEPDTPTAYLALVRGCRVAATRRATAANHALRAEAALTWFGGASFAGGVVTTSLAGLEIREREGVVGAAVATTLTAGVALVARLVEPGASARARYEATRAHERAASLGVALLVEVDARIAAHDRDAVHDNANAPLRHYRAELHAHVQRELSSCVALDPSQAPTRPPNPPARREPATTRPGAARSSP